MNSDSGFATRDSATSHARDSAAGHGGTEVLRRKMLGPRIAVSPWLVTMVGAAIMLTGCGSDSTPTTPTNTSTTVTENWSSVVAPGGASTRSFTVTSAGTIAVTLTDAGATVGLGVGLPRVSGGGCRLGVAVNASAAATPQITTQADAGQYCVQVYDLGTLTEPIGFVLKIEHP